MASTFAYTTNTRVQSRVKLYDTAITTAEIDEFITDAEGFINAYCQYSWKSKATIPYLIARLATNMAAFTVLSADPSSFTSLSEAQAIADMLFVDIERDLAILRDPKVLAYIKGET